MLAVEFYAKLHWLVEGKPCYPGQSDEQREERRTGFTSPLRGEESR